MHTHNLHRWKHAHAFHVDDGHGERNTRRVILLTVTMMVVEIIAGYAFGSMALLADGWHMGTHTIALGITAFAYTYARRHADNPRFSFGTGKVGVLGGFTSAVLLAVVALLLAVESIERLVHPREIQFNEAIGVAVIGLVVNIISALLLQRRHGHRHDSDHNHHEDHNLRAAYLHVLADALTSFLAIFALSAGKVLGWIWMDPLMGIVGTILITRWSYGLMRDTSRILLDSTVSQKTLSAILSRIESDSDTRVSDIHIWPLGSHHFAAIVSIVTHYPKSPKHYKDLLSDFEDLEHVTVEVNVCEGESCVAPL